MREENVVSPCRVRLSVSHIICNGAVQNQKSIRQKSMLFNRFPMSGGNLRRRLDS